MTNAHCSHQPRQKQEQTVSLEIVPLFLLYENIRAELMSLREIGPLLQAYMTNFRRRLTMATDDALINLLYVPLRHLQKRVTSDGTLLSKFVRLQLAGLVREVYEYVDPSRIVQKHRTAIKDLFSLLDKFQPLYNAADPLREDFLVLLQT